MSDLPVDPPGRRPTTRESTVNPTTREPIASPTTREGGGGQPSEGLTLLPTALRDRYRSLGELPSTWGGEASLLLAERIADGETVVVKVYQRGLVLDPEVLEKLSTAQLDHVVVLHEAGESDGRWYEVQEYIRGGTLLDLSGRFPAGLPTKELRAVIKELTAAVHHLHGLRVMHKDLKPANILVRSLKPFDLVLADFGLASLTDLSMRAVSKSRTAAYSAPELRAGFAGWASDWWSVGIIVAELAGGTHPFDGLQEQAIDFAVAMRSVPLVHVEDPDVQNLCRGLLQRDTEQRWGAREIAAWLKGEAPLVAEGAPPPGGGGPEPERGFEFNGSIFVEPRSLARAMAGAWSDAARLVGGANQREVLVGWMRQQSTSQRVARLLDDWAGSDPGPDKRVAQILAALDPELPTIPFRDVDLAPGNLSGLADEVLAGTDDSPEARALNEVFDQEILPIYGSIDQTLPRIDARWRTATERATQVIESCSSQSHFALTPAVRTRLRAQAIRITADRGAAEELAREVARIRRDAQGSPDEVAWFRQLTELPPGPDGGLEVALVMLFPLAREQADVATRQAAEARERAKQEERAHRQAQLAPRMRRARKGVGWATMILAAHAAALVVAHQNTTELAEEAATMRLEGNEEAAGWIDRLIDLSAWSWLPALLAVVGIVVVLWARARRNMTSSTEVTLTLRAAQGVAAVQAAATPLLWPFGLRWIFAGRANQHTSNTTGTDRRRGILGAWLLGSYAAGLTIVKDHAWGSHLYEPWPDDLLQQYFERWPATLRIDQLLTAHEWTIEFAQVFTLAALVLAWRSYTKSGPAAQPERWVLRSLGCLGLVAVVAAPITTVPIAAALLALYIVTTIVLGMIGEI